MIAKAWVRRSSLCLTVAATLVGGGAAAQVSPAPADSARATGAVMDVRVVQVPAHAREDSTGLGRAVTISGRVIPAGGGDVRGVRVLVHAGARADSADVDSTGRFAIALSGSAADSMDLWVDAADPAARTFAPARLRLGTGDAARAQEIVLVPLRWTIRGGTYDGKVVDVPLAPAFRGVCASCNGFYRRFTSHADPDRALLPGWPAARLPLRVAFDREWNGQRISDADSIAFWREADDLNRALGVDVFQPADYRSTEPRPDGGPEDVILVWVDPDMRGLSGLGTSVSSHDDIEYGDVRLSPSTLREADRNPGLVAHELMHTLGFGHTCSWPSVLADVRRCPELVAHGATPQDVAYAQLAGALRTLLRDNGHRWGLEAALAAMDAPRQPGLAAR